jgi:RNA polymerase sigma-70 factor (ECF subfamily)
VPADAARGDDPAVIARLAAGETAAMGEIYDRHARAVYSLACRILSDRLEAEDVVQDVFAQAWRQAGRYDPARGAVSTWLLVMTRARAIDRLRARRGRPPAGPDLSELDRAVEAPGQEAGAIAAEQVGRLRLAMQALPDGQRTAIELAYYEGLSQSEIATRLAEPLGTIKTRIRTGLLRLRALLTRQEPA